MFPRTQLVQTLLQQELLPQQEQESQPLLPLVAPVSGTATASRTDVTSIPSKSISGSSSVKLACASMGFTPSKRSDRLRPGEPAVGDRAIAVLRTSRRRKVTAGALGCRWRHGRS